MAECSGILAETGSRLPAGHAAVACMRNKDQAATEAGAPGDDTDGTFEVLTAQAPSPSIARFNGLTFFLNASDHGGSCAAATEQSWGCEPIACFNAI